MPIVTERSIMDDIQALGNIAASGLVIGVGVLIGLALILYAQFKYNKGLF